MKFVLIPIMSINVVCAQEIETKKDCDIATFKCSFPDTLANGSIDTLLREKIQKYFIKKIKYPKQVLADCVSGEFFVKFKLRDNRIDTTQLKILNGLHELTDNQIIELFKQMPAFQLKSINNIQKLAINTKESEFYIKFNFSTTDPRPKRKKAKATMKRIDNRRK